MSHSIRELLLHIQTETQFLLEHSTGLSEARFFSDELLKRAFVRSLEIVGEATKQIPQTFRDQYPAIPRREMAGMRDRLIHQYAGVNFRVVWETITLDLPGLHQQISLLLERNDL